MSTLILLLVFAGVPAAAAPADPFTPIRIFIDAFNKGDTKTAFATYAPGSIAIVDEFAPHVWTGPKAPQAWAAAYDKNAAATGVSDGHVSYAEPTRREVGKTTAYVVVPTVYTYKEHGKAIAEEGSVTAALAMTKSGWKMTAWTWTGVVPHAAK